MLYLSPPYLTQADHEAVAAALASGWVAPVGPDLVAFEEVVMQSTGAAGAVALSSGTAALHLALRLAGVGQGDAVLVQNFNFAAAAFAVNYVGAQPIFIGSEADTWNADVALARQALAEHGHIKAAIVTDLYGMPANWTVWRQLANETGLVLIEDAAEAVGSSYHGKSCGTLGDYGVFSFNGNKILTTSGGGMLLTQRAEDATRARYLATQAKMPKPYYEHEELGYNYRLSNVLAALGKSQWLQLEDRLAHRAQVRAWYQHYLANGPWQVAGLSNTESAKSNYWLTTVLWSWVSNMPNLDTLCASLYAQGIEVRRLWQPLHQMPLYQKEQAYLHETPVEISLFDAGLCLPSGCKLSEQDVAMIANTLLSLSL